MGGRRGVLPFKVIGGSSWMKVYIWSSPWVQRPLSLLILGVLGHREVHIWYASIILPQTDKVD